MNVARIATASLPFDAFPTAASIWVMIMLSFVEGLGCCCAGFGLMGGAWLFWGAGFLPCPCLAWEAVGGCFGDLGFAPGAGFLSAGGFALDGARLADFGKLGQP